MRRVPPERIAEFAERALLATGVHGESARVTAAGLCHASLRGVDSHGIRLLPHYLRGVEGGRINADPQLRFEKTSPSTGVLDADDGFGHAAGTRAMHAAIDLARNAGSGHVAVRNSSHSGSMAYFAEAACAEDMIGFAYTNATPKMRSANATRPFFGTNPVCMAAPMADEAPFCYDGATTLLSANRIRVYGDRGESLPPGCGADSDGAETLDPQQVVQLLPIGDYKGFGIAMIVDVLCSLLTGMPSGNAVSDMFNDPLDRKRELGQFYSALRIDTFENPGVFKSRLQALATRIRNEPRQKPDTPVMVPGDPEKAAHAERSARGIPVPAEMLVEFQAIAVHLGIEPLVEF